MFCVSWAFKRRNIFVGDNRFAGCIARPVAEDIIFKTVCVNLKQRKWKILSQLAPSFSSSLLSGVFHEFKNHPRLVLDFYQIIGGHKAILQSMESCCVVIHVMVDQRDFGNALCLIKELMITQGYFPLHIYEALMCSSSKFFRSNMVLYVLIKACTEIGETKGAHEVIKKMVEQKLWVPIRAMNNFLSHLLKIDEIGKFWLIHREMNSYHCHGNVNTYNLLIYALCKECKLLEAFSAFYIMLKNGIVPNIVGFNMLIDGACRANDLFLAEKLFHKIETMSSGLICPNIVTYNCLINGYCKSDKLENAEKFLYKLLETDMKPNLRSYATLLDGYSRNGCLEKACSLCSSMIKSGMILNSAVYNSFIHFLYMEGDIFGASLILLDMRENHISPDKFTYSIIVKGLCKKGHIYEALKFYKWFREMNTPQDTFSYNILVDYLCRSNDILCVNLLLCSMFKCGLAPDQITYGSMINAYCKAGEIEAAVKVYTDMVNTRGIKPNLVIYNSILNGLCRVESLDLLSSLLFEMKEINMFDTVSCNTLLNGYCNAGKFDEAFCFVSSMNKAGFFMNKVTYNIMINLFCKNGLFENCKEVIRMMQSRGFAPDSITYTTILMSLSKKCCEAEVIKMHDYLMLEGVTVDRETYETIVCPIIIKLSTV